MGVFMKKIFFVYVFLLFGFSYGQKGEWVDGFFKHPEPHVNITVVNPYEDNVNLYYAEDSIYKPIQRKRSIDNAESERCERQNLPHPEWRADTFKLPESGQPFEWIAKLDNKETRKKISVVKGWQIIAVPCWAGTEPESLDSVQFSEIPKDRFKSGTAPTWKIYFDADLVPDPTQQVVDGRKWVLRNKKDSSK
jgi:hypothetical protein